MAGAGRGLIPLRKSFPFLTFGSLPLKCGHLSRENQMREQVVNKQRCNFLPSGPHFLDEETEAGSEQLKKRQG